MRAVHHPAALFGYSTGGAVLTLVLPLGLFIVIMIAMYFVFGRRHTVPGRSTVVAAKPVAPEPLADRGTPPKVGALREDIAADDDDTAVSDTAVGDTAVSDPAAGDASADEPAAGGNQANPE